MTDVESDIESSSYLIPGYFVLPALALWVSFSCSRSFGLPKVEGFIDISFERVIFLVIISYCFFFVTLNKIPIRVKSSAEVSLWAVTGIAALSGVIYGGFASKYTGADINILFNLLLMPATAFSLVLRTRTTHKDFMFFSLILVIFGAYLGLTSVFERTGPTWIVFPPEIVNNRILQHWGRSRGPFLQAEFNGTVMVQLIPVALLLALRSGVLRRMLCFVTILLLCIGVFLTETRAAMLSLTVVTVLGCTLGARQRSLYIVLLAVLLLSLASAYILDMNIMPRIGDVVTIYDRLKLLSVTFEMIYHNPLTGVGFGMFDLLQEDFFEPGARLFASFAAGGFWAGGTHNTPLTAIAELGVIPGGLYFFLLLRTIYVALQLTARANRKGFHEEAVICACSLLVCVSFVLNAMFVELRFSLTPNALFWVFGAFVEKYRCQDRFK